MIERCVAFFGFEEEISPLGLIMGPLLLIFAIVLALKASPLFNYDLLLIAIIGLFLTAKWKIRGCVAALLLLAFSSGAKHVLLPTQHAWQAGLEGSVGLSLFLSALIFERNANWVVSKLTELERNEKTILFLEEDLGQQKEWTAKESASFIEKQEVLRLQLEELQSESATFQILNEVLRKTTAKAVEEKETSLARNLHFDRREGLLLEEIDSLQQELNRLGNEAALVQQNQQLFHELNETRLREAQTHLINETLVRLHAKEHQKVRECESKLIELAPDKNIELLYRQLRGQFEEKNQILHQTRAELFQSDTALQMLQKKMEEKEFESPPLFKEMNQEVDSMVEEISLLQQENKELQDLVSCLISLPVKKKS